MTQQSQTTKLPEVKKKLSSLVAASGAALLLGGCIVSLAQAQPAPNGINSRIPGVGSLGTNPGYRDQTSQDKYYFDQLCIRFGSQYGAKPIRSYPDKHNNVICDMDRASFVIPWRKRFGM